MKKICDFCGEEFETNRSKARFCKRDHFGECVICGKKFPVPQPKQPSKFCSDECRRARPRKQVECVCQMDGCGKTFMSDRKTSKFCPGPHYRNCVVCGKEFELSMFNRNNPASTCSRKCAQATVDQEQQQQNYLKTMREKYGVDNISQLEEIKDKKRQTCMDHYGVDNPSRAPEVQKKRDETFMERFGGNPWKSEEVRKKIAATCMERYGAQNPFMLDEFQKKARDSVFKKYGVKNIFMLPEVRKKAAERCSRISKVNYEWKKSLEDATGLEFETEVRFGDDVYADLGVPDKKLLIEINPAVTHNSTIHYAHLTGRCKEFIDTGKCESSKHIPQAEKYHQARTLMAHDAGFTLLQYFDWMDCDIFVSIVKSKLSLCSNSVGARQCTLHEISQKRANKFLKENHMLGASNGQTLCLGLFYKNDLVHVQTYGPARFRKDVEWEAIRACSKTDWHIQGGFSKCDKYFFNQVEPDSVVSYVDLSTGYGSTELMFDGWEQKKVNRPGSTWVRIKNGTGPAFIRDSAARRVSADRLLGFEVGDVYPRFLEDGTKLTNADVLLAEGYVQVFDCGTSVNVWRKQEE